MRDVGCKGDNIMTLTSVLYLTDVVSHIDSVFGSFIVVYLLSSGICGFIYIISNATENEPSQMALNILNILYKKFWLFLIILSITIFVPSKQTMYLMLGANYLQQSGLPTKVSEALELKLDDVIKQLRDKK